LAAEARHGADEKARLAAEERHRLEEQARLAAAARHEADEKARLAAQERQRQEDDLRSAAEARYQAEEGARLAAKARYGAERKAQRAAEARIVMEQKAHKAAQRRNAVEVAANDSAREREVAETALKNLARAPMSAADLGSFVEGSQRQALRDSKLTGGLRTLFERVPQSGGRGRLRAGAALVGVLVALGTGYWWGQTTSPAASAALPSVNGSIPASLFKEPGPALRLRLDREPDLQKPVK
jgi:membrane protein involved in colicin uptake